MANVEAKTYIDFHDEGYWVAGTRVSLDSLVYCWREGLSPETIQRECFESLTLSQVFGALAYYLDHQAQIDQYLIETEAKAKVIREQVRAAYPQAAQLTDKIAGLVAGKQYEHTAAS